MKTSDLHSFDKPGQDPVNETKGQNPRKLKSAINSMIRIYVEDFNNHPVSYATVRLSSGGFSTELKFDKSSNAYIATKFIPDRYDLEVKADFFETHRNNFFIPKSGIERIVCLAKS